MIAKISVLFAVLAATQASLWGPAAIAHTGVSSRSQVQDGLGNYAFGYNIKDGAGAANSRSEVGDGYGNKKGSYALADIDGRARRVDYVADGHGFRAVVKTNEPGTAASAPAAAVIASPYAGPVGPSAISHVAPGIIGAPLLGAPVAYGGVIGHGGALGLGGLGYGGLLGLGGLGHGGLLGLGGLGHGGLLGLGGLGYGKGIIG